MGFSDYGITGRVTTKDGKKFYDVPVKKADDIINTNILVYDFETDVVTSQGPGRYVIKIFAYEGIYKFVTNSFTLKTQLNLGLEKGILPSEKGFPTVLRKKDLGNGKKDYYFE